MSTFMYFAYGSNMLTTRLRERCGSARPLGVATLPGYELKWHKRSKDGSGKCDIVQVCEGEAVVHGVLYEVSEHEKSTLDRSEGLGRGYEEAAVEVMLEGQPMIVMAYVATDIDSSLRPFDWYHAFVVEGGVEHGLPAEYVTALKSVETMRDA